MPELPEVETLRLELAPVLINARFKSVQVSWPKSVRPLSGARFARVLQGRRIIGLERQAKVLLFKLDNSETLAIHLKMTGQLIYVGSEKTINGGHPEDLAKYTRVVFSFADGSILKFNDLRKFGWLKILDTADYQVLTAKHGLEPLSSEFSFENFMRALKRYPNRKLKAALLDQTLIAGLGNIYADESCFAADLLPTRQVKTLKPAELKKLHAAIKRILKLAVAKGGTSVRDYRRSDGNPGGFTRLLKVYGRAGTRCEKCHTPIVKIKLASRGTHYCPKCQR